MAKQITVRDMNKRVARYKKLKPQPWIFIDFALPEGARDILSVIGGGVMDRGALEIPPAIPDARNFHVAMARCRPNKGAALHAHKTEEVFIPMDGKWSVFWGDKGEREVILDKGDTISVPPGVMRGFKNVGRKESTLLAILGGKDPGTLKWSPDVLKRAKANGYGLDAKGYIKQLAK